MAAWDEDKKALVLRLKRIEGQVRALAAAVDAERDCEHVVQQFAATRKAMDRAFFDLMACVTRHELEQAGADSRKVRDRLGKVTELLARYG